MDGSNSHADQDPTASNEPPNQRRGNVFENIHAGDHVFQFIGSVNAHTTTARSISAESHSTMCLGDLSKSTLEQISADRRATAREDTAEQSSTAMLGSFPGYGRRLGTDA